MPPRPLFGMDTASAASSHHQHHHSSANSMVTPSELEVDYDKNITPLYEAITNCDWDTAAVVVKAHPEQARTWVVRHYEDEDEEDDHNNKTNKEIMWRFLPIHSACARQPPATVIAALLKAYPDGARCRDDQGMYPLHYACGNQASREVVRLLLVAYPDAAKLSDPRGMLPIHYLACWGPSSVSIIDMVLVAHRDVGNAKDADGNTPMDLAVEGDYPERDAVVAALNRWLANNTAPISSNNSVGGNSNAMSKRENSPRKMIVSAPTGTTVTTTSTAHSGSVPSPYISVVKEEKKEPDARGTISNRSASPARNMSPVRGRSASPALRVETNTITPRGMSNLETGSLGSYHDTNAMAGYNSRAVDVASPRTVNRLRMEIAKLKQDQKAKEEKWDEQLNLSKESWKMQVSQLEDRLADQKDELEQLTTQLEEAKRDVMDKLEALEHAHNQIGQLEHELNATADERDGLRMTLAELTEQHDLYKKKSEHMNDRLGSLSASLQSMMSEQQKVVNGLRERETAIQRGAKLRKDRLKELLKHEDELDTVFGQNDDLRSAVEKQSREMDAIAAVIAVARQ